MTGASVPDPVCYRGPDPGGGQGFWKDKRKIAMVSGIAGGFLILIIVVVAVVVSSGQDPVLFGNDFAIQLTLYQI